MATLKKSCLGGVFHLHRPPLSQVFTYSLFDERVESVNGVLLSARLNSPFVNDLVSTVCLMKRLPQKGGNVEFPALVNGSKFNGV